MTDTATNSLLENPPPIPVGKILTFGPIGPKYEVRELLRPLGDNDWMLAVKLVETGEETEYRYSRMIDDPVAI